MKSLEYRENINYCDYGYRTADTNIDEQLLQLAEQLRGGVHDVQLYDRIRRKIYKDIKINELAITKILGDIWQIEEFNPQIAKIVVFFLLNSDISYQKIASKFCCSKQNVYQILKRLSNKYLWLKNLLQIKGQQDKRNDNNRINKM